MGVRAVLLALLAGLLALGSGYVILPGMHMFYEPDDPSSEMAGPNNPFSLKWSMAQNNSYDYGLNGGIAFVFSPDFDTFCKQLLFKMPENDGAFQWARCEEMQNAVMRAMATWEANHQMIKFVDVTKACEREAEAYVSPAYGLPGNNARGKFPGKGTRGDMRFCKQAELVITSGAPDTPGSTVAAMVQHYSGDTPGRPDPGESSPPFGSPCEPDRQRCNALQSCREFAAQVCPDTCPDGGPCDCTCEGDYILNGGLDEGPQVPTFRYNSVGAVRQWQNPNNFGATGPMSTGGRLADPPCLERRLGEDSLEPPCLESILPTEDSKDYTVGKVRAAPPLPRVAHHQPPPPVCLPSPLCPCHFSACRQPCTSTTIFAGTLTIPSAARSMPPTRRASTSRRS